MYLVHFASCVKFDFDPVVIRHIQCTSEWSKPLNETVFISKEWSFYERLPKGNQITEQVSPYVSFLTADNARAIYGFSNQWIVFVRVSTVSNFEWCTVHQAHTKLTRLLLFTGLIQLTIKSDKIYVPKQSEMTHNSHSILNKHSAYE